MLKEFAADHGSLFLTAMFLLLSFGIFSGVLIWMKIVGQSFFNKSKELPFYDN